MKKWLLLSTLALTLVACGDTQTDQSASVEEESKQEVLGESKTSEVESSQEENQASDDSEDKAIEEDSSDLEEAEAPNELNEETEQAVNDQEETKETDSQEKTSPSPESQTGQTNEVVSSKKEGQSVKATPSKEYEELDFDLSEVPDRAVDPETGIVDLEALDQVQKEAAIEVENYALNRVAEISGYKSDKFIYFVATEATGLINVEIREKGQDSEGQGTNLVGIYQYDPKIDAMETLN